MIKGIELAQKLVLNSAFFVVENGGNFEIQLNDSEINLEIIFNVEKEDLNKILIVDEVIILNVDEESITIEVTKYSDYSFNFEEFKNFLKNCKLDITNLTLPTEDIPALSFEEEELQGWEHLYFNGEFIKFYNQQVYCVNNWRPKIFKYIAKLLENRNKLISECLLTFSEFPDVTDSHDYSLYDILTNDKKNEKLIFELTLPDHIQVLKLPVKESLELLKTSINKTLKDYENYKIIIQNKDYISTIELESPEQLHSNLEIFMSKLNHVGKKIDSNINGL